MPRKLAPDSLEPRAGELHRAGMRFVRDIWHSSEVRFLRADKVSTRFGLRPEETGAWYTVLAVYAAQWPKLMQDPPEYAKEYDWVGIFADPDDELPVCVVPCENGFTLPLRAQRSD